MAWFVECLKVAYFTNTLQKIKYESKLKKWLKISKTIFVGLTQIWTVFSKNRSSLCINSFHDDEEKPHQVDILAWSILILFWLKVIEFVKT